MTMQGFGVHTSMWTMNWDRAGAEKAIAGAVHYKMDFIEIALLNAPAVDARHSRELLEKNGLKAVCSLGLPQENWASVNPGGAIEHLKIAIDKTAEMGCLALPALPMAGLASAPVFRRRKRNMTISPKRSRRRRNMPRREASFSGSSPSTDMRTI
jgi:sugar phosphate isomerase/epimerase